MKVLENFLKLFAFFLILIFLIPNLGFGGEPGVTDDTIAIGGIFDLSGPLAFAGTPMSHGIELYLKKINERGEIHGRKFKYVVEDDGYQVPRTIAAYKKLMSQGIFTLLLGSGSANMEALTPLVEKDKMPAFFTGGSRAPRIPPKRYIFHTGTMYGIQGQVMIENIMNVLAKGKKPKIAAIYQDDASGEGYQEGFREKLNEYGLKLSEELSFKRGTVDFSAQMAKVYQNEPDYVLLNCALREAAAMLSEAKKFTWKHEPQFMVHPFGTDNRLFGLVDPEDRFVRKLIGASFIALEDGDNPGSIEYRSSLKKYDPTYKPTSWGVWGYGEAMYIVEAIRRIGREITREKLVDEFESLKNYDAGGIFPPLNFSPTDRIGPRGLFFMKVEKKGFVKATDWITVK